MPAVSLTINGRLYEVVCDDSQVERVRSLADQLDNRARGLLAQLGTQPESRLLLMLALTLADEMAEIIDQKGALESELDNLRAQQRSMADAVVDLTGRIEAVANRMERA